MANKISNIIGRIKFVYTEADTENEIYNLLSIEQDSFTILGIRGGANLFGQEGNYIGIIFIMNGCITGVMIDHWTGEMYSALGTSYQSDFKIRFIHKS